jgi:arylsulfatase A-like enzyme
MFMSDNGPSKSSILDEFGHNQNQLDLENESITLAGAKGGQGEAGHRTPFLWRYPRRFSPKSIYDPKVPVSTVDIYATLAELIGYQLGTCFVSFQRENENMTLPEIDPTRTTILANPDKRLKILTPINSLKLIILYT